jgi:broad-specificity NMP kinase
MTTITISGLPGTGKTTVAKLLETTWVAIRLFR